MANTKLGPQQQKLLELIHSRGGRGITKGHLPSQDWRRIDRLERLGLIKQRFVLLQGPTYFAAR